MSAETPAIQTLPDPLAGPARPRISVILPTFNRAETLERVLQAWLAQDIEPEAFEIVVADDGSSDATPAVLRTMAERLGPRLTVVVLGRNRGPAAARNAALARAVGDWVVITGDDIVVPAGFLRGHRDWHAQHPAREDALLGYVTWAPTAAVSPFMRWLERGGRDYFFDYGPRTARPVSSALFYTCNVSLKRSLLEAAGPFDTDFRFASHEDLEMGYRLERCGMRLHFDPAVYAWHDHALRVDTSVRRVYRMGYSAHTYWRKVPDRAPLVRRVWRGVFARVFSLAAWRSVLVRFNGPELDDGREHPLRWKIALAMAYGMGLGDARMGREAIPPASPGPDR